MFVIEKHSLRIGEVAGMAHVSVETVRYYEQVGLLPKASRTNSGYRIFPDGTIERIQFIKQAQEIGFSLGEIKDLFISGGDENQCRNVRNLLQQKLIELEDRLTRIVKFKNILAGHVELCEMELEAKGKSAQCPVLTTITISNR